MCNFAIASSLDNCTTYSFTIAQKEHFKMKRRTLLTIQALVGLALTALIIYVYTPVRDNNALKAICRVDAQSCYQLITSHKDTLYFSLREKKLFVTLKIFLIKKDFSICSRKASLCF